MFEADSLLLLCVSIVQTMNSYICVLVVRVPLTFVSNPSGIKLVLVPVAHHADQSKALEIKCIIAVP